MRVKGDFHFKNHNQNTSHYTGKKMKIKQVSAIFFLISSFVFLWSSNQDSQSQKILQDLDNMKVAGTIINGELVYSEGL